MTTQLVNEWTLPKKDAEKYGLSADVDSSCDTLINTDISLFLSDENGTQKGGELLTLLNSEYQKVHDDLESERWVSLTREIYFDKQANGCWLIQKSHRANDTFDSGTELTEVEQQINTWIKDPINQWVISSETQLRMITNLNQAPFPLTRKRPTATDAYILYSLNNKVQGLDCDTGYFRVHFAGVSLPFLAFLQKISSAKVLFITLLEKGLIPIALEKSPEYQLLLAIFHRKQKGIFKEQEITSQQFLQQQYNVAQTQSVCSILLKADKIRADIAPYHAKILEDDQLGHWSLWPITGNNPTEQVSIPLSTPLVARDPQSSLNEGVVGIDFGTKSTVVVYQKDTVHIHPMRIGTGDLSKEIAAFHYENPTIMEFNDLERFRRDYQVKANKPLTRWQDLTISHTAKGAMLGCDSSQFNTFLEQIKQWAGDKNRKLKIVGKQGKMIDLPPFLELGEDDFNPIEIYAYYLGCYINNLNNGIFLDYILSFPVTYEMPIRDKIIESFTKGLQKSLPPELGADTLAQLTVTKGASEPAAYALVALQAFKFDPSDEERIFYSVFDFGGGTTDFDFGIFREANAPKERRFDYVIEHFGAGGDKFLGGENLLELLAFEIFKNNSTTLLAKNIQFEKHPEKEAFAGSEQLLNTSQEAKINTKTLSEILRPFWEGDTDSPLDLSSGSLALNLTDVHGVVQTAFELTINEDELNTLLYDRIERGVINFFEALRLAFSNTACLQDIENIKIFLAGNSSQSPFVSKIFEQQIALQHKEMQHPDDQPSRFELFPPLGTDTDDVEKPTGKTGVAFGLIESREGGDIKVIDHNVGDDIRFKFYLGESRKKCFKAIIDREVKFNQWIEFVDASYQKFELYYTDQPSASTGEMAISDSAIKKNVIKLERCDEDAMVYLRIVSPTKIEYVIAYEKDIENERYLNAIQSFELT